MTGRGCGLTRTLARAAYRKSCLMCSGASVRPHSPTRSSRCGVASKYRLSGRPSSNGAGRNAASWIQANSAAAAWSAASSPHSTAWQVCRVKLQKPGDVLADRVGEAGRLGPLQVEEDLRVAGLQERAERLLDGHGGQDAGRFPHPDHRVPQVVVAEADEGAVDEVVVHVEQALLERVDVGEPLGRPVVVPGRLDQTPGEGVDDLQRVGQAVAVADR